MKRNSFCASSFFCFHSVNSLHCIGLLTKATLKLPVFWSSRKLTSLRGGASALPPLTIFHSLSALQRWPNCTQIRHHQRESRRCCIPGVSTFQDCISSVTSRCTQLWWNFLTLTMPSTWWHCVTLTMPPLWWNFVNHQNVNIPPCGWNFLTLQVHLAGWNCPTLKSATMEGWTCNVTVPEGHGCVQMVTSK
jgi:hypothetical protein